MIFFRLAINQITCVDPDSFLTEYNCEEIEESIDKTWIVSGNHKLWNFYRIIFFSFSFHSLLILGQSPDQKEIIKNLPKNKALFVEGAFRVWLKKSQVKKRSS